jgi:hypothetical protein
MQDSGPGIQGILPQDLRLAPDQVEERARVAEFNGQETRRGGIIRAWIASSPTAGR